LDATFYVKREKKRNSNLHEEINVQAVPFSNGFMKVIKLRSARSECDLLMSLISITNSAFSGRSWEKKFIKKFVEST